MPAIPIYLDILDVKDLLSIFKDENDVKDIKDLKLKLKLYSNKEIIDRGRGLLEIEGYMVSLSGIGKFYFRKYREFINTKIYLSDIVKEQFKESSGNVRKNFENILLRLKDSRYRFEKQHGSIPCDSIIYKWYKMGNTSEMVLYYEKNDGDITKIYVCELLLHDEKLYFI